MVSHAEPVPIKTQCSQDCPATESFDSARGRRVIAWWFVILLIVAAASAILILTVPGFAEEPVTGMGIRPSEATQGTLLFRSEQQSLLLPAPVLKTDVEMKVTGPIARATVRQQFQNPSPEWAEGIYVFPLPEEAAVDHLRMRIGERIIEGVIKERAEAKKAYETRKPPASAPALWNRSAPISSPPRLPTSALVRLSPSRSSTSNCCILIEDSSGCDFQWSLDRGTSRARHWQIPGRAGVMADASSKQKAAMVGCPIPTPFRTPPASHRLLSIRARVPSIPSR